MHPKVWEASGHVWWFNDPLIDDKKTWERFRADKLIEDHMSHGFKELNDSEILSQIQKDIDSNIASIVPDSWTNDQQYKYIIFYKLRNPNTKKDADWTEIRKFSLMLATKLGVIEDDSAKIWLRPETAQAMFVKPEESQEQFDKFVEQAWYFWKQIIGIKEENMRTRDHWKDELAHYARQAKDYEFKFPRWRGELNWIHDRTDFDVKAHQEYSSKNLMYNDPMTGQRYIPFVIELSMWLSRAILTTMANAYDEETYTDGNWNEQTRIVARFHPNVAPIRYAIIPLIKKDEKQVAIAKKLYKDLTMKYMCEYDDSGNIGKSYRRQDEIWTPYCITIDNQTLVDWTVTVRERDTMKQERKKIEEIV